MKGIGNPATGAPLGFWSSRNMLIPHICIAGPHLRGPPSLWCLFRFVQSEHARFVGGDG